MNQSFARKRLLPISNVILCAVFIGAVLPYAAAQNSTAKNQKAAASSSDYVGSETCATCHEEESKSFNAGPHWRTTLDTRHGEAFQGCEGCHGPGKAHVESGGEKSKIFSFTSAAPQEVSARCLSCHEQSEEHANFERSAHNLSRVTCLNCHSQHHAKDEVKLLKTEQPQLCYGCHLARKSDFAKPFHHRVNEGLIKCTDCHNPHGGFLTRQLRASSDQQAVCYRCHSDKQGPFVFEHVPIKTEGCVSCHDPHGSTNPRLLRVSQMNLLCLQCHTITFNNPVPGAPTFHNQAARYQACTLCHAQIHGSNFNEFFFR